MLEEILEVAPWPTEIMAITEAMPMTIPKMVKADLDLLEDNEKYVS